MCVKESACFVSVPIGRDVCGAHCCPWSNSLAVTERCSQWPRLLGSASDHPKGVLERPLCDKGEDLPACLLREQGVVDIREDMKLEIVAAWVRARPNASPSWSSLPS